MSFKIVYDPRTKNSKVEPCHILPNANNFAGTGYPAGTVVECMSCKKQYKLKQNIEFIYFWRRLLLPRHIPSDELNIPQAMVTLMRDIDPSDPSERVFEKVLSDQSNSDDIANVRDNYVSM